MKKKWLYSLALVCALGLFTACSDDDEPANWQKLPTESISAENLTLTTNAQSFPNASVSLTMNDAQTGTLTLTNAIRGLNEVAVNVTLAEQTDGSFQFQGTTSVATTKALADLVSATTVNVSGNITVQGQAVVDVTTSVSGPLVKKWLLGDALHYGYRTDSDGDGINDTDSYLAAAPFRMSWVSTYGEQNPGLATDNISTVASPALSVFMTQLLNSVEFKADGSIVANYASQMPALDFSQIMGVMFGSPLPSRDGIEWIDSPANLAYWYAADDHIYVVLDIANIMAKSAEDQGQEAPSLDIASLLAQLSTVSGAEIKELLGAFLGAMGGDNSLLSKLDLSNISDADVERLVNYLVNGFPLDYQIQQLTLSNGSQVQDVFVYLDKDVFDMIMPLLYPLLPDLQTMVENLQMEMYGSSTPVWPLIQMLTGLNSLTEIEGIWDTTSEFKIGLDLAASSLIVTE